jgi:hypothetical protein
MYVNVNPANMARSIQAFVNANGGGASYSSALELVARMCGFDAYRAQKAYAEANAKKDSVVFETTFYAWDRADATELGMSDTQTDLRNVPYRLIVERDGDQFRLCIVPDAVKDPIHSVGQNVLDIMLEINEGLPCLHLTNDPAGEMLLTVFGHAGGLLVREDEGALENPGSANAKLEEHLQVEEWTPEKLPWQSKAYVINHDTRAIWADALGAAESEVSTNPASRYDVSASFDESVATTPGAQWFDLDVYEYSTTEGKVACEPWHVGIEHSFSDSFPMSDSVQFCKAMSAAFTALYRRWEESDTAMAPTVLVQMCLIGGLKTAQRLVEVADLHPEASYAELEKLYRMTAAVWSLQRK